eukprot:comp19286_c0_seq2/m.36241 comp19286_c0_seq2/g.36241  ORF comp19286_c0_seq2/g.36241 comp19286_c0_seq2/m.36241 type:complete len:390 (-) comp19286_c0_seq2:2250-3419(-)
MMHKAVLLRGIDQISKPRRGHGELVLVALFPSCGRPASLAAVLVLVSAACARCCAGAAWLFLVALAARARGLFGSQARCFADDIRVCGLLASRMHQKRRNGVRWARHDIVKEQAVGTEPRGRKQGAHRLWRRKGVEADFLDLKCGGIRGEHGDCPGQRAAVSRLAVAPECVSFGDGLECSEGHAHGEHIETLQCVVAPQCECAVVCMRGAADLDRKGGLEIAGGADLQHEHMRPLADGHFCVMALELEGGHLAAGREDCWDFANHGRVGVVFSFRVAVPAREIAAHKIDFCARLMHHAAVVDEIRVECIRKHLQSRFEPRDLCGIQALCRGRGGGGHVRKQIVARGRKIAIFPARCLAVVVLRGRRLAGAALGCACGRDVLFAAALARC